MFYRRLILLILLILLIEDYILYWFYVFFTIFYIHSDLLVLHFTLINCKHPCISSSFAFSSFLLPGRLTACWIFLSSPDVWFFFFLLSLQLHRHYSIRWFHSVLFSSVQSPILSTLRVLLPTNILVTLSITSSLSLVFSLFNYDTQVFRFVLFRTSQHTEYIAVIIDLYILAIMCCFKW